LVNVSQCIIYCLQNRPYCEVFPYLLYLQELSKREVVNVTHLVIPAELGALLQAASGTAGQFSSR